MHTPSISDVMEAYAKGAKEDSRKRGFILDYSEASLENLDQILHSITSGDVLKPQTESEKDDLRAFSKMYGGYLGQVVIREMTGAGELHDLPDGSARIVLRCCDIQAFPPEKICKRLTEDRYSNVGGYCRGLRAILEMRRTENQK